MRRPAAAATLMSLLAGSTALAGSVTSPAALGPVKKGTAFLTTVPSGSDLINRQISDQLANIIDLMDFHNADGSPVHCDGVTLDTTGIQAAVNFAGSSNYNNNSAMLIWPMDRKCLVAYLTVSSSGAQTWLGAGPSSSVLLQTAGTNLPLTRVSGVYVGTHNIVPLPHLLIMNMGFVGAGATDSSYFWSSAQERKNVGTEDLQRTAAPANDSIVTARKRVHGVEERAVAGDGERRQRPFYGQRDVRRHQHHRHAGGHLSHRHFLHHHRHQFRDRPGHHLERAGSGRGGRQVLYRLRRLATAVSGRGFRPTRPPPTTIRISGSTCRTSPSPTQPATRCR